MFISLFITFFLLGHPATPLANDVTIKCECTQVHLGLPTKCYDIKTAKSEDLYAWPLTAHLPPNGDTVDWDAYCFRKRDDHAKNIGCDHLEDKGNRYYRGTVVK